MADEWDAFPVVKATDPWDAFPRVGTGADIAKGLGVGVAQGAIDMAGMGADAATLAGMGARKLGASDEAVGFVRDALKYTPLGVLTSGPGSADIKKKVEGVTGEFYKPQTTLGKGAETVGSFVPGALIPAGGASWLSRLLRFAVAPGVASETAGQVAQAQMPAAEPYARVVAALAAPSVAGRALMPLQASPARQRAVDVLHQEGITPMAGQATGSATLRAAEAAAGDMPLTAGRVAQMKERVQGDLNRAAMRRGGENVRAAGPDEMHHMFERLGNNFQDIGRRNTANLDNALWRDLADVATEYGRNVNDYVRSPLIMGTIRDIVNTAQNTGGTMAGGPLISMRSRLSANAREATDPNLRRALHGMVEALDDVLERSISPRDAQLLATTRTEYRNAIALREAATRGGEQADLGNLTPASLRNAVVAKHGRENWAVGQGPFADLARAASSVLREYPSSGTAQRTFYMNAPGAVIGGLGGLAAGGDAGSAALGTLGGLAGQTVLTRALLSGPGQAYLAGRIPGQRAVAGRGEHEQLLRALLAAEASRQGTQ